MPFLSYPHVSPSRHGALPVDRISATPADVSAAHRFRSPGCEVQMMIPCGADGGCCCGCGSGSTDCARAIDEHTKRNTVAAAPAAARLQDITTAVTARDVPHGSALLLEKPRVHCRDRV